MNKYSCWFRIIGIRNTFPKRERLFNIEDMFNQEYKNILYTSINFQNNPEGD